MYAAEIDRAKANEIEKLGRETIKGTKELTERIRNLEGTLSHGDSIGICKFQARKDHNHEIIYTRWAIRFNRLPDQEKKTQNPRNSNRYEKGEKRDIPGEETVCDSSKTRVCCERNGFGWKLGKKNRDKSISKMEKEYLN